EVAVVAGSLDGGAERRIDEAVRGRRRAERCPEGIGEEPRDHHDLEASRLSRLSSLSGRKREKTRSHSSKSRRIAARSQTVAPKTATSMPMEGKDCGSGDTRLGLRRGRGAARRCPRGRARGYVCGGT